MNEGHTGGRQFEFTHDRDKPTCPHCGGPPHYAPRFEIRNGRFVRVCPWVDTGHRPINPAYFSVQVAGHEIPADDRFACGWKHRAGHAPEFFPKLRPLHETPLARRGRETPGAFLYPVNEPIYAGRPTRE